MNMSKTSSQAGYTLVGVLFIFVLLSVLGLSITTLAVTSYKNSSKEKFHQSAFYIAESGINKRMEEVVEQIKTIHKKDTITNETEFYDALQTIVDEGATRYLQFEKVKHIQPEATVSIQRVNNTENEFKIESIGEIRDESRKLATTFSVGWNDSGSVGSGNEGGSGPPFAVFTIGQYTMSNGTINGDIGTFSKQDYSLSFPGNSGSRFLNGNVYALDNKVKIDDPYDFVPEVNELNQKYSFPELKPFPDIPHNYKCLPDREIEKNQHEKYKVIKDCNLRLDNYIVKNYEFLIDQNMKFNEINLGAGITANFKVEGGPKEIVVKHLKLGYEKINFTGSDNLNIYVTDTISLDGSTSVNDEGNINDLNIYYAGTEPINDSEFKLYGSIYVKDADITIGSSANVFGNIIVGGNNNELNFQGDSTTDSQFVFAPYSTVNFKGSGKFKGKIISNNFNMTGGATLNYSEDLDIEGPLSIEELLGNKGDQNKPDSFTVKRQSIIEFD